MGRGAEQPPRHQGHAALTGWFPRPEREEDIEILEPSGPWTPRAVLDLLADPGAVEWRHKVGVAGPVDGSAKPTTRLLATRGWVAKTRMEHGFRTRAEAVAHALAARAPGRAVGLWPPEKLWAVIGAGGLHYPITISREVRTLRTLGSFDERLAAWTEMLQAGIDVHHLHGRGLDLNPANFGRDPREEGGGRLHYIDDELYDGLDVCNLAGAIAARVPEEPKAEPADWRAWGLTLRQSLGMGGFSWETIRDEILRYPLPERWEAARTELLAGLADPPRSKARQGPPEITCVLADVHSNLPALEAVLADARAHGADAYLFLGDAVGYGPHPAECVRRLADLPRAILVRGNHDHAMATGKLDVAMNSLARQCASWTRAELGPSEIAWLDGLPLDHVEEKWMAVHGAPKDPHRFLAYVYELTYEDNLKNLRDRKVALCFYGHTHVQLVHVELAGGPSKLPGPRRIEIHEKHQWLVNPGSVGQPRDGDPRAAYALWNRRTNELTGRRIPYDLERTIRAARAASLPPQIEERLRAGA